MSKYLLDTDIFSYWSDEKSLNHTPVVRRIETLNDNDLLGISVLSVYEYEYGISLLKNKGFQKEFRNKLSSILEFIEVIPLNVDASKIFGEIQSCYKQKTGMNSNAIKKHNIDCMIAASAISESAILMCNDRIYDILVGLGNIGKENGLKIERILDSGINTVKKEV